MVRSLAGPNLSLTGQANPLGAFSPSDVANLSWWIDPDDGDTVTLSGSEITGIEDKVAGTSAAKLVRRNVQPGPNLTTFTGTDWMDCDGATSGRVLNITDPALAAVDAAAGNITVFVVVRPTFTGGAADANVFGKGFTGWYRLQSRGSIASLSLSGFADESGGAGFRVADTAADVMVQNSKHILRYTIDRAANLLRVHVDGTEKATADISTLGTVTDAAEKFVICARASGATQTSFWTGLIGETIFYKDTVAGADATAIEAYLAAKWGTV